ncbi:MAG: serine--tRNA ligase [Acidobacteria bacterium]|nr:serine--tRNA ligase [Acidobacteriota bacterium]MBI3656512.1 serine--tRNA ligase [Acidobacteriota bacterium]
MLDMKFVLENIDHVAERLRTRGTAVIDTLNQIKSYDTSRRALILQVEQRKSLRNTTSEQIGRMKRNQEDTAALQAHMREVNQEIKLLEEKLKVVEDSIAALCPTVPNIPHTSVPVGADETGNLEVRRCGIPRKFPFPPKDHVDLGEGLGILHSQRAAKITGARFSLLAGMGARMERALINFMLDTHSRHHGYTEVFPPFMANRASFFGTGNLPKFEADLFKVEGTDFLLAPTAEVPVTNIYRDEILDADRLPIYLTAYTPCFRSEAGSHGKDVRGLIRQHQFNKVELVKFTAAETSYEELEKLVADAESILKRLELPYRVVALSTGDMGFSAAKTYDIEVWLPSQDRYREISSCSNFEDFQARRANIRYRPQPGAKPRFVHTLNGSGLAIGRTWLAILENYQLEDGSVVVPEALRLYMDGIEKIEKGRVL